MTKYYITYINDGIRYYIGYDGRKYYLTNDKTNASKFFTEQTAELIIKEYVIPTLPSLVKTYERGYFELILEVTVQGRRYDINGNSMKNL